MLLEASWLLLQVPERCSVSTGGGEMGSVAPPRPWGPSQQRRSQQRLFLLLALRGLK